MARLKGGRSEQRLASVLCMRYSQMLDCRIGFEYVMDVCMDGSTDYAT